MHFGATLRLLRVDAGFTLRDLADRIGVSNAYLSRVENGHDAPPTPNRLVALASAFGLGPTTLIELTDRIAPATADYFEVVPSARALMLDIVRRKLTPVDVARIRAFIAREFPERAPPAHDVARMLDRSRVVVDLACSDLEDAVDVAATRLAEKGSTLSSAAIAHAIMTREATCASALGSGLAVPHAVIGSGRPHAVVVTLRRPLVVDTPDGAPLRLLIVHVHPGAPSHTVALAQLARLAEEAIVATAASSRTPHEIIETLCAAIG
jgi:PTS system nitrogen regulatory IIA component